LRVARSRSSARNLSLDQNAALFAALANAIADARIGAWMSKYEQKFWRPISAANAEVDGAVTNGYVAFHGEPSVATRAKPRHRQRDHSPGFWSGRSSRVPTSSECTEETRVTDSSGGISA
jgi:hypothetical protein